MKKHYYFDYAATTPVDVRVVKAMAKYWSDDFGNASSIHWFGQRARAAVEQARQTIADYLYVQPHEILFTSGATEGDNLAIKGVVDFYRQLWLAQKINQQPHIITSYIEHPAVIESGLNLEKKGCQLSLVKPGLNGIVNVVDIIKQIKDNTVLISLMYVNNEVGTIQPVKELGKQLLAINKERIDRHFPKIYFHVDAVQALNYCNCRPKHIEADLMTFSGHKISGPKGIGFNFIKEKTPLIRQQDGGSQERGIRAGTFNSSGIVGLATAIKLLGSEQEKRIKTVSQYKNQLITTMRQYKKIGFNGSLTEAIPSTCNISFPNFSSEDLVIKLDLMGLAVSAGSACAAGAIKVSPVLRAMGVREEQAKKSIRLSWGKDTTSEEFKYLLNCLKKIVADDKNTKK